jgi:hypothetical protein
LAYDLKFNPQWSKVNHEQPRLVICTPAPDLS